MSVFPVWEKYVVHQKGPYSGCIPTRYEMLLQAAKIPGINLENFQDEFDLDKKRTPYEQPINNFESVAKAISRRYPHVKFKHISFPRVCGLDKLKFIEEYISSQKPILISLSLSPDGSWGWHIMPVVYVTDDELILLDHVELDGSKKTERLLKSEFVRIHNEFIGGNDLAYLEI